MAEKAKDNDKKKVLIVDDDAELGKLLERFFVSAGVSATAVVKGKQAIEVYSELRPDLVLLDLLLPDIMGLDVLKRMREPPWAKDVAIILMSGVIKDEKTKTAGTAGGATAFLAKPFNVREMHNMILKHLGHKPIEEQQSKSDSMGLTAVGTRPEKPVKAPTIPEPGVAIEEGDLAQVDLPRILAAFFTAKVSGVLKVAADDVLKAVYFEDGLPIFAASKDPRDRLGEITLRTGLITKKQLDDALAICKEEVRLGVALIQTGALKAEDLSNLIYTQVREIIFSLFAWQSGRYAFAFENLAGREMIKLKSAPANLVMEGIRRYYDVGRLKKLLVSMDRVLVKSPNPQFRDQELFLGHSENKILELVNGQRTIQKVIDQAGVPMLLVLQLIYGLVAMKVLIDKPAP